MRSSVVMLIAVVGGYFAYHLWFAPEEETEAQTEFVVDPAAADESDGDSESLIDGSEGTEDGFGQNRPDLRIGPTSRDDAHLGSDSPGGGPSDSEKRAASAQQRRENAAWKLYTKLKAARNASQREDSKKLAQQIQSRFEGTDAARMLLFERGRAALQRYEELGRTPEGYVAAQEARKLLTPALFISSEIVDPDQRDDLRVRLRELADDLLFSGRAVDGVSYIFRTRPGDTLDVLCRKVFPKKWTVRVAPGLVMSINGIRRPQDLRAEVNIRVPRGAPAIVVVKSEFRLYFLLDGAYVRDWVVGLGAERSSTPVGNFEIRSKIRNPDWFPRQGVKIPYGNPRNILGTRWMGFRDTPGLSGFGIHGTTRPQSIGKKESSGCIRMRKNDVETLFGWTPRGAPVEIRR